MIPTTQSKVSLRQKLSARLGRVRQKLRQPPSEHEDRSPHSRSAYTPNPLDNKPVGLDTKPIKTHRPDLDRTLVGRHITTLVTSKDNCPEQGHSTDLWSAAYREAIESLGDEIDVAILTGKNVADMFAKLEGIEAEATHESAFLRGVAYLRSVQVPLEKCKLVLDLASPLSSINPTASAVVGVVRGVTAIAISFATADAAFAKQIGEMLEQMQYIDECDTLGQKSNRADIHKSLVPIYRSMLEFYMAAYEILTRRGVKLIMKMVIETDRLPNVIQDFLRHAADLHKTITKATLEITEEIRHMVYDNRIASWLDEGRIGWQSRYQETLLELCDREACAFLLAYREFTQWYDNPSVSWLTIFGDTGCGKSITAAFLVEELQGRSKYQLPQPKIYYHYCRDDETSHVEYVFSTLIFGLLGQLPGLKKVFCEWHEQIRASQNVHAAKSARKLAEFLETVLAGLDRTVVFVIDGIDECDQESQGLLLELLQSIVQKSPRLKVATFSRPGTALERLEAVTKIYMHPDSHRDVIIARRNVQQYLGERPEEMKKLIITTLSDRAQGSAIWIKMVTLHIAAERLDTLEPTRLFLDQIPLPQDLAKLYTKILLRQTANTMGNTVLIIAALKILSVACRPLSISELAWAVALSVHRDRVKSIAYLSQLVQIRRVVDIIRPFISSVDLTDLAARQIRLVHQSVKDFTVQELPRLETSAIVQADQHMVQQRSGTHHAFLLDLCIDYLLLEEIDACQVFSEEQIVIDELPQDVELFNDRISSEYDGNCTWEAWEQNMVRYDPSERGFGHFFVYAASYWPIHFGRVERGNLPSLAKIEKLCQAGSTRLDNWIKQNCRPDCALKARFDFDSRLYDPLSITSLYGSKAMLDKMLECSTFDRNTYHTATFFDAADQLLQWGDLSRLRTLFSSARLGDQVQNLDFFDLVVRRWSDCKARHDNWETAFDLIDILASTLIQEQEYILMLSTAARAGCLPLVRRLCDKARSSTQMRAELISSCQALAEAVLGNHADVVEYLLDQRMFGENSQCFANGETHILRHASKRCNPAIFRLLLAHLPAKTYQIKSWLVMTLSWIVTSTASLQDRCESMQILLLAEPSPGQLSYVLDESCDPLGEAVRLGEVEMCRLLVCEGKFDPHSVLKTVDHGNMVLTKKPAMNEEAILDLLRTHAITDRVLS